MDSTMTSKVTGEEKTDKMVDMTGGMTAQMTTPKRMVSSEGVMSTAMDTTPSMKSVSPMMMGEKTDGETDEAMTMTMTMGKASTDGSMKTSKLMSTLQAMTQSSEMTDTKKPMDNVMSSQGMTATAKMTQEAMTPTMMDMMKDTTMKASPSQEMKTSPMDDQTKPKSTKSMTSFPPPPPMTTTAPPRDGRPPWTKLYPYHVTEGINDAAAYYNVILLRCIRKYRWTSVFHRETAIQIRQSDHNSFLIPVKTHRLAYIAFVPAHSITGECAINDCLPHLGWDHL
ncbi:hypothetical protein BSL78_13512 [Apostichopus japonicus]|uniref:Uncharacterized protein n=1 Tax=Stichopus japonicus TaxID=307972 RepID=A0A2G8KNM5_STIJA|nr:hypothetical protein BSL78_13512 [Apostichopus japonicus]